MRRTPQEKKKLSYEKDRRNTYGESPHSSRKSIPRRKAFRNRANRHRQDLALRQLPNRIDEGLADQIESGVFHYAPKDWKKRPDKPLRVVVERKLEGRRRFQEEGGRRRRSSQNHSV
jgi:hypothetical protein